jgi:acyl-CoA reductase-like NAD-dependent aldehyde dehydrogenase
MAKNNQSTGRLEVLKTYKIFIGGKFPRTESGRYYSPEVNGRALGNLCLCSRKDLREAVVAARAAQSGWAGMTAYNRGQIFYRIGEILEGRRDQFITELQHQGLSESAARREVEISVDRWIHYAGWCDKYQQVFSSVNPVASSHFNFSVLEPMGVVFLIASEASPLLGLVSMLAPIIASGNTVIVLASESKPLSAITLAEVIATSDVPGGVVNILTGPKSEMVSHAAKHFDINAIADDSRTPAQFEQIQSAAAANVKRVKSYEIDWDLSNSQNPYLITDYCETKTTWHPIEKISSTGSGY